MHECESPTWTYTVPRVWNREIYIGDAMLVPGCCNSALFPCFWTGPCRKAKKLAAIRLIMTYIFGLTKIPVIFPGTLTFALRSTCDQVLSAMGSQALTSRPHCCKATINCNSLQIVWWLRCVTRCSQGHTKHAVHARWSSYTHRDFLVKRLQGIVQYRGHHHRLTSIQRLFPPRQREECCVSHRSPVGRVIRTANYQCVTTFRYCLDCFPTCACH